VRLPFDITRGRALSSKEVRILAILRRFAPALLGLYLSLQPALTSAWQEPAGSPPEWEPHWVQTTEKSTIYMQAEGDQSFGEVASGLYFRVDAPVLNSRLWVYNPLADGWAWIPRSNAKTIDEPTPEQVQATVTPTDPRAYLYQKAGPLAASLDCIITHESGWVPSRQNSSSRASGLAQFIPSTWASTPQGQRGMSPFEPFANIDAAIWLAQTRGLTQWTPYLIGRCH
jgi:hypothetical protein